MVASSPDDCYGGIDPAQVFEESKCMLHWPATKRHELVDPSEVGKYGVKVWCVETPVTRGAASGFKPVWNMYGVAMQFLTRLAMGGGIVVAPDANIIRSKMCQWPPRDAKGKIVKTMKFDPFLYNALPAWGYPVGKGTVLGMSKKPGPDIRDALLAAMFAGLRLELIQQYIWKYPFK